MHTKYMYISYTTINLPFSTLLESDMWSDLKQLRTFRSNLPGFSPVPMPKLLWMLCRTN